MGRDLCLEFVAALILEVMRSKTGWPQPYREVQKTIVMQFPMKLFQGPDWALAFLGLIF